MGILAGVIVGALVPIVRGLFDERPHPLPKARVALDLSQKQEKWHNLAQWTHVVVPNLVEVTDAVDTETLDRFRVLILPLPFHEPLSEDKMAALRRWVRNGGGLLFLAHYAGDVHHGTNPSSLTRGWGVELVQSYLLPESTNCENWRGDNLKPVPPERSLVRVGVEESSIHPIVHGVHELYAGASAALSLLSGNAGQDFLLRADSGTTVCRAETKVCSEDGLSCTVDFVFAESDAPIVVAALDNVGAGRVVIAGTWKLLFDKGDNHLFLRNVVDWLAHDN